MTRVLIPYSENHHRSILIALSTFKEYSNLRLDEIGKLLEQFFHGKKDIYCDIPTENLAMVLSSLEFDGFTYRLIEN